MADSRTDPRDLPASPGRPATVVLSPSLGLDGATGRPIWSIGAGPVDFERERRQGLASRADRSRRHDGLPHGHADHGRGDYCPPRAWQPDRRRYVTIRAGSARFPGLARLSPMQTRSCKSALAATLINVCIPVGDSLVGHPKTILEHAAAAGPAGRGRDSSDRLFGPELVDSRSTPNAVPPWWGEFLGVVLLAMGGVPIVAYATAFVLSLVRLRWLKLVLALPVVAAILVAGSSALISLIPAKPSIGGAVVVVDSPRCRHAVDERFADRGLRGRARFIPGPPALA